MTQIAQLTCICHGPMCRFCDRIINNKHVADEFVVGSMGVEEDTGRPWGEVIDMRGQCSCPVCPACADVNGAVRECEWGCF